jgi:hypothetical protein
MIPVSHALRIATILVLAAFTLIACAGPSDEARCKGGGGIWNGDSCEYSSR